MKKLLLALTFLFLVGHAYANNQLSDPVIVEKAVTIDFGDLEKVSINQIKRQYNKTFKSMLKNADADDQISIIIIGKRINKNTTEYKVDFKGTLVEIKNKRESALNTFLELVKK